MEYPIFGEHEISRSPGALFLRSENNKNNLLLSY